MGADESPARRSRAAREVGWSVVTVQPEPNRPGGSAPDRATPSLSSRTRTSGADSGFSPRGNRPWISTDSPTITVALGPGSPPSLATSAVQLCSSPRCIAATGAVKASITPRARLLTITDRLVRTAVAGIAGSSSPASVLPCCRSVGSGADPSEPAPTSVMCVHLAPVALRSHCGRVARSHRTVHLALVYPSGQRDRIGSNTRTLSRERRGRLMEIGGTMSSDLAAARLFGGTSGRVSSVAGPPSPLRFP
jgi:hypothetical protein